MRFVGAVAARREMTNVVAAIGADRIETENCRHPPVEQTRYSSRYRNRLHDNTDAPLGIDIVEKRDQQEQNKEK